MVVVAAAAAVVVVVVVVVVAAAAAAAVIVILILIVIMNHKFTERVEIRVLEDARAERRFDHRHLCHRDLSTAIA